MFSAFRRCREHSFEKFQTNSTIRYIGNPLIWIRVTEIISCEQSATFFPNYAYVPHIRQNHATFQHKQQFAKGAVNKLRLQDSGFFWPPTPLHLHFLWYEFLQKVDYFGPPGTYLPRFVNVVLWMTPNESQTTFLKLKKNTVKFRALGSLL